MMPPDMPLSETAATDLIKQYNAIEESLSNALIELRSLPLQSAHYSAANWKALTDKYEDAVDTLKTMKQEMEYLAGNIAARMRLNAENAKPRLNKQLPVKPAPLAHPEVVAKYWEYAAMKDRQTFLEQNPRAALFQRVYSLPLSAVCGEAITVNGQCASWFAHYSKWIKNMIALHSGSGKSCSFDEFLAWIYE